MRTCTPWKTATAFPNHGLQQGTAANVQKYFGLTWGPNPDNAAENCWTYVHTSGTTSPINTLNKVAQLTGTNAREPDFFELLKASINAGALGKSGVTGTSGPAQPYAAQFTTDTSVDYHILQIGANIIDQFDADGYPTTIHWSNNPETRRTSWEWKTCLTCTEMRAMLITARMPVPNVWPHQSAFLDSGTNALLDSGVAILMWLPEIWNPHDWDGSATPNARLSFGNPAPTSFQIFAQCESPASTCYLNPGAFIDEPAQVTWYITQANRALTTNYPSGLRSNNFGLDGSFSTTPVNPGEYGYDVHHPIEHATLGCGRALSRADDPF